MKKIYVTAAVIAAMSTAFVSCTNELDAPAGSSIVEDQAGRIVFNVNTGKSVSFTKSSVAEDQVINNLSVFVFDELGSRVLGIKEDYLASDITDGKLSVTLPSDQMNKRGFKAYIVANITPGEIGTETQLMEFVATTTPAEISTKGIPMASAPISLNTTTPVIAAEAVMKRTMSSLFVKVNPSDLNGTAVNAGDFTYKVKNVYLAGGYMLKDEVCTGDPSEGIWTPKANTNAEELLGYMYQSNGFEVEITPSADKPGLGSASRTVVVAADKAMKRNKKYVLNVLPKVSETGTIDFTVTVQDWDVTDGSFNVDWVDNVSIDRDAILQNHKIKEVDGEFVLTPAYNYAGASINHSAPRDWFAMNGGAVFRDIAVTPLYDSEGNGLSLVGDWLRGNCLNFTDIIGKATVTTIKDNVLAKQEFPVRLEGRYVKMSEDLSFGDNEYLFGYTESDTRLIVFPNRNAPGASFNPSMGMALRYFPIAEGWTITGAGKDVNLSNPLSNGMTVGLEGGFLQFKNTRNCKSDLTAFVIEISKGDKKVFREFFVRYDANYELPNN